MAAEVDCSGSPNPGGGGVAAPMLEMSDALVSKRLLAPVVVDEMLPPLVRL